MYKHTEYTLGANEGNLATLHLPVFQEEIVADWRKYGMDGPFLISGDRDEIPTRSMPLFFDNSGTAESGAALFLDSALLLFRTSLRVLRGNCGYYQKLKEKYFLRGVAFKLVLVPRNKEEPLYPRIVPCYWLIITIGKNSIHGVAFKLVLQPISSKPKDRK